MMVKLVSKYNVLRHIIKIIKNFLLLALFPYYTVPTNNALSSCFRRKELLKNMFLKSDFFISLPKYFKL